jgi:hypothetical protein
MMDRYDVYGLYLVMVLTGVLLLGVQWLVLR